MSLTPLTGPRPRIANDPFSVLANMAPPPQLDVPDELPLWRKLLSGGLASVGAGLGGNPQPALDQFQQREQTRLAIEQENQQRMMDYQQQVHEARIALFEEFQRQNRFDTEQKNLQKRHEEELKARKEEADADRAARRTAQTEKQTESFKSAAKSIQEFQANYIDIEYDTLGMGGPQSPQRKKALWDALVNEVRLYQAGMTAGEIMSTNQALMAIQKNLLGTSDPGILAEPVRHPYINPEGKHDFKQQQGPSPEGSVLAPGSPLSNIQTQSRGLKSGDLRPDVGRLYPQARR